MSKLILPPEGDMLSRIEWIENVPVFATSEKLEGIAKLANWSKCSPGYVNYIPRHMVKELLDGKYLFYYDGEYVSVFGIKGEDDKSVLSDLSHADLGFGGEDSG